MAAGLTQPIFDGLRLQGQLDFQKGRQDELLQLYRKAIVNGFADVERALIAVQQTALRERLQREVVRSSRQGLRHRRDAAAGGHDRPGHRAQHPADAVPGPGLLAQARLVRLQAVVSLFQALGGGWQKPKEDRPVKASIGPLKAPERSQNAHEMCVMCCESAGRAAIYGRGDSGWLEMASSRRSIATALVALVVIGAAAAYWWQPARTQQQRGGRGVGDDGPVPVIAAAPAADVPVYLDGVGTIKALNTVTVRPQVDGKLLSVNYTEGQQVERGYVLARIDPITYQAAYDQAVAKKAQDEATLANARLDLDRYNRLAASNSVPRQQLDTQKATVAQQEAQVKLDQAVIDNAKAILDYTTIIAPLAGRTGIRLSIKAITCAPRTPPASSSSRSCSRSRCCSPCRSSSSATSTEPSPPGL